MLFALDHADASGEVVDTITFPVPYHYFHMLNVMVCVTLILYAYGMALSCSLWAPIVFGCVSLIILSMYA